ncbi:hypothetical protein NE235_10780 [Actinoallomurus spadix]|uniref:Uncharacterized protein n=1 Tax=Actinoallomurus spadix TaxID=79912 RepID=A0ABN0WVQ4_9ACTN|nr:hypothetical protein [Actinoallomurus spadix]MCO5986587.1 hypothetical protein [Actinoallomurus spadix]
MPRWLKVQPAAVGSAAAAVYVAASMLYRAVIAHTGVFEPDELVAAIAAVYALWARTVVTPLARPRDKGGRPLTLRATATPGEHWPQPGQM